jgi:hypothetical protein
MNIKFSFLDKLGAVGAFLVAASCPVYFPLLGGAADLSQFKGMK